ncbi:MAG: energy transducer TonB [Chitinophagaceae bacterium]|jgi:protein TonB
MLSKCLKPPYNLQDWIAKNLVYPVEAQKNGEQGRVIVQFVVKKDGTISDVKVVRGISKSCNDAAMDLIKKMPAWKPGKQNGRPVNVSFSLPVTFKLQ